MFLYLHGFNSSPGSYKAQATEQWLQQYHPGISFHCPQLSCYLLETIALLEQLIVSSEEQVVLAGSSMGGYFATWLAQKYHLRTVLINPAVKPYLGLSQYLGENVNDHTGEIWELEQCHIDQFRELEVESLNRPENYWTLLQTGDEVLDYRLAEQKYCRGKLTVEPGGDHSFQGYQRYLPAICEFLLDV